MFASTTHLPSEPSNQHNFSTSTYLRRFCLHNLQWLCNDVNFWQDHDSRCTYFFYFALYCCDVHLFRNKSLCLLKISSLDRRREGIIEKTERKEANGALDDRNRGTSYSKSRNEAEGYCGRWPDRLRYIDCDWFFLAKKKRQERPNDQKRWSDGLDRKHKLGLHSFRQPRLNQRCQEPDLESE